MDPVEILLERTKTNKSIIKKRDTLTFSFIPKLILHRDLEQKQITQTMLPLLQQSKPSNLLIYGKTGTGKTLVVQKVLSQIKDHLSKNKIPIKLCYTNSKTESTVYGVLVSLGRQLGLDGKSLPSSGLSISEVFKRLLLIINKTNSSVVFVLDEIDYLATLIAKTQKDIMYQLTRANELLSGGSLTIIGISNDLTFKERLDPRVLSSLSEEEIVFTNYTSLQLHKILEDRAKHAFLEGAVTKSAINLCSAMAAKEHGDARRAIDLLRVAGEIAEREQDNRVTEKHIRLASKKIEENKEVTALRSYPLHEKILIFSVMKCGGLSTGMIYSTYKNTCKTTRQTPLTQRRVTQILAEIEMSGIISSKIIHSGSHGRTKKFSLSIPTSIIKNVFAEDLILGDII